jgi:hypothetical protein
MGCFAVCAILASVFVPNFLRARAYNQWIACKSNLKNLATALEMYGTDNQGHYPAQAGRIVPRYLRQIPTCPAAGADSYTASYQVSMSPDTFSLACSGLHHSPDGAPSYHAEEGLIEGPLPRRSSLNSMGDAVVALFLVVGCLWTFVVQVAIAWPEPLPETESILKSRPRLARLNYLSWPGLCLFLAALIAWALPLEGWLGRFCLGSFLGTPLARWLVYLGGGLWRRLSPSETRTEAPRPRPRLGPGPRLDDPYVVEVALSGRQKQLAARFTGTVPWMTLILLTGVPALGQQPLTALRGSLLGFAAGMMVVFPAYRWARHWSQELFQRQLEWVPGSGELILHSRRWGRPHSLALGTQADVELIEVVDKKVSRLTVAGCPYLVPSGPWLKNLQNNLPPRES